MTGGSGIRVDCHSLTGAAALSAIDVVQEIYADIYAEPPYCEGPADVKEFVEGWPRRVGQAGFRLVLARCGDGLAGFTFGHQLLPGTHWWKGATTHFPDDLTKEFPGRTFVIIELAVRKECRRRGVGRALHDALLSEKTEERVTLLARPEAEPAQRAYRSWGYRHVGQIRPFPGGPLYGSLLREKL